MLFATAALAVPVTYTVVGANFTGGGSISGTFTYDADTNTYSAINLVTTAGGVYPGATFVATNGAFSSANILNVVTASGNGGGQPVLNLQWNSPLTNAGGTIIIQPTSAEGLCRTPCSGFEEPPTRRVLAAAGSISSTAAIPTLTEWAMILFGLMLAGGAALYIQRRQSIA